MHPRREMNALAQAKIRLRARIATRRAACRDAVTTLSAPLEWIDLAVACVRRVAAVQDAKLARARNPIIRPGLCANRTVA
jgi:hypothetical protein